MRAKQQGLFQHLRQLGKLFCNVLDYGLLHSGNSPNFRVSTRRENLQALSYKGIENYMEELRLSHCIQ
jgi:hypothetical protein